MGSYPEHNSDLYIHCHARISFHVTARDRIGAVECKNENGCLRFREDARRDRTPEQVHHKEAFQNRMLPVASWASTTSIIQFFIHCTPQDCTALYSPARYTQYNELNYATRNVNFFHVTVHAATSTASTIHIVAKVDLDLTRE
jgi:hypothetical protein